MSLDNTHDIGNVKIVMVGAGGSGGSYTAGSGISISNSVITNIRKGALTGVIDSVSSNIAHTQIDNALTTTTAGALIVLKAETSGTSIDTVRVQYGEQASDSRDFRLRDTSGNYTTIDIASDDTIIMMLDITGYQMIVLSILGASIGGGYAGLGIGKKKTVTSGVIDTDIDLHRAPIVGDRLLIYFDEKVTNPTGLTTYNNGTAVTSNLENAISLYINAGWNILEFKNDGLLYDNCWVRVQNVPLPISTLSGLSDTAIVSPSDGQLLTFDNETQKWKNKTYVEANTGSPVTELKKLKVGNVVYDTDGMKNYSVTNVANNNITVSVLNPEQFVQEVIAINTGNHTGSSSAWNLVLSGGMIPVSVALKNADGTAFSDDIHENELLFVYVDTAGNVARVLDIPVNNTEIKTATGNPITLTDAIAGNAIEVSAEIVASQDLHGYDKPWVGGAGKNQVEETLVACSIESNGAISTDRIDWSMQIAKVTQGQTYTIKSDDPNHAVYGFFSSKPTAGSVSYNGQRYISSSYTITAPIDGYVAFRTTNGYTTPQCEVGSESTSYEPYSNICPISGRTSVTITDVDAESQTATVTVQLGQTVYGGTLNLTSGELTVTHGFITLDGTQEIIIANWKPKANSIGWLYRYNLTNAKVLGGDEVGDIISNSLTAKTYNQLYNDDVTGITSYTDTSYGLVVRVADTSLTTSALINAYLASNPIQVCYELATPTTTTLTAAQLALVKGYNQLSCNSGDMSITYKASGLDALKERVDDLEDAVADLETDVASKAEKTTIGTVESGTTASQPYAVGEHFIRNDAFCTAIAAIASGATLTQGTNYVEGTIAECIARQGTYSTTETEIGTLNGKRFYRKMVDCGTMPNATQKWVSANLGNIDHMVNCYGYAKDSGGSQIALPYINPTASWNAAIQYCDSTHTTHPDSVQITVQQNFTNYTDTWAILEYTKNS